MNDCVSWSDERGCCTLFDGGACPDRLMCVGYCRRTSVVPTSVPSCSRESVELTRVDDPEPSAAPFVKFGTFRGKPTVTVGVKGEF